MNSPSSPPADCRPVAGLATAAAVLFAAAAAALAPPPVVSVAAWAEEARWIAAESGSPAPGKWSNAKVPYLVEVMEELSPTSPATDVVFKKSAQVGGTEVGLNLFGATVLSQPRPLLIVLPSLDEAKKYNRVKLAPAIDATPALAAAVAEHKSRDADSSTAGYKRFPGGYAVVTGANSSKGLQMISAGTIVFEEVSEYPYDVDERGDPVDLAIKRGQAWEKYRPKRFFNSTPGLAGACRIEQRYQASDQRRYYVACPHCGVWQTLRPENLRSDRAEPPFAAYFACAASGCVIQARHQGAMVAGGVWIKTFPDREGRAPQPVIQPADLPAWRARDSEGRQPGFAIWQAYSPFATWDGIVRERREAGEDPRKLKVYRQQTEGEPWEERGDAPPAERLMERRQPWPPRQVPPGVLLLTGAVDVQGNRLEWYVWGWGVGLTAWLVDRGVVLGDPADPLTWRGLDPLLARSWPDGRGRAWTLDALGVDAGYLSQQVYRWTARHAGSARVFALDGRGDWRLPAIGLPAKRAIDYEGQRRPAGAPGAVLLWPVGTADLKSEHYSGLRKTLDGPDPDGNHPVGTIHLSEAVDREVMDQLTAETLRTVPIGKTGLVKRVWAKSEHRANEALDCAVYARALAHHLTDELSPEDWARLAAARAGSAAAAQRDLAALWAPPLPPAAAESPVDPGTGGEAAGAAAAGGMVAAAPVEPAPAPAPRGRGVRGRVVH